MGTDSIISSISPDAYIALVRNLEMGVLIANDEAVYLGANEAACQLYGRGRSEIIGSSVYDFVPPERREEVALQWSAFLRHGRQDGIFPIAGSDGTPRWLAFHAQANFSPGLHVSFLTPSPAPADAPKSSDQVVTVCAWTKDLKVDGSWVTFESYLSRKEGLVVTHGISPRAFAAFHQSLGEKRKQEVLD